MKIVLAVLLFSSSFALAQPKKMVVPPTATSYPAYNGPIHTPNEITGSFGLVGGAFNLGVTYVKPNPDFGIGGYFFYQAGKEKNSQTAVTQVTALGALLKVNIVDNRSIRAYLAPGFGLAILKDASISNGKKSDENLISPTFKMGVQYKTSPTFIVGLERMQFANWLNDSLNNYFPTGEYYSVVGTFEF